MPDIHIFVSKEGSEQWPRFIIRDSWGRVWTGREWNHDEAMSQLFQDENKAISKATDLYLSSKVRMFTTALNVYVENNQPLSVEALQEFLIRNCRGWIDNDGSTQTLEDSTIKVEVEWEHLEEIE